MTDQTNGQSTPSPANQSNGDVLINNPVPKTDRPQSNAYQYVILAVLSPLLVPVVGLVGLIGYPLNRLLFGGDKYDPKGFNKPEINQSINPTAGQNVQYSYRKSVTGLWLFQRLYLPAGVSFDSQSANHAVKGIVFLIHGFGEHFGRKGYQSLINQLTSQNLIVCMIDQIGHGQSTGNRAYVQDFEHLVDDQVQFIQSVNQSLNPLFDNNLPRFIFGHSMGGLQAVHVTIKLTQLNRLSSQPIKLAGMLVSSPAAKADPKVATPINVLAARIFSFLFPKLGIASVESAMISRSEEAVRDYKADPLVYQGKMPARYAAQAMKGQNSLAVSHDQPSPISLLHLPSLLLHGTDDQICSIDGSEFILSQLSSSDKQLKRFEGAKHEVIEDPIEGEAYKNSIVNFIVERC